MFFNKSKNNILKMTQENLRVTQENNEIIHSFLKKIFDSNNTNENIKISSEKKLMAAYALNLCTVSVSQIVDYDDIGFLEYEYEAILNNLNLENMPKDEELLKILKQLLDVITFFKIQEEDKSILEKEYQCKLKNAVWSAVPNINVLVGNSPVNIALSLASQIGTGYMNYRKAKAELGLENNNKLWSLQKSAMEQFNGLKKELFDTAWRLADKYGFKDEFRLTERQITQFNQILLDNDPLRKCERLEYIKSKFQAYPPFFYYLANSANDVFRNDTYGLEIRSKYKIIAIENYQYFLNLTQYNILREDQLEASASLELFEILEDKKESIRLLERAIKASDNTFDVVQICAIAYLRLGLKEKAKEFLRYLMNEKYNYEINAQLLSKLYVLDHIDGKKEAFFEYEEINRRFPEILLFPFPDENNILEDMEQKFIGLEKIHIRKNISKTLVDYISKFNQRYNSLLDKDYDISEDMVLFFNDMIDGISICGENETTAFKNVFLERLDILNESFNKMLRSYDEGITRKPLISFKDLVEEAFIAFAKVISSKITCIESQEEISKMEEIIFRFKEKNNLSKRNTIDNNLDIIQKINYKLIDRKDYKLEKRMMNIIQDEKYQKKNLLKVNSNKIDYYIKGENEFISYIQRHPEINKDDPILAIINDRSIKDLDLLITTKGLLYLKSNITHKKKICLEDTKFSKVEIGKNINQICIGNEQYSDDRVNINLLYEMIKELAKITNQAIVDDWYEQYEDIIVYLK